MGISEDVDGIVEQTILQEVSVEKEENVSLSARKIKLLKVNKYVQTAEQIVYIRDTSNN